MKSERTNLRRYLVLPEFDLKQALCGQTDPELFFAEQQGTGTINAAKRICNECPVRIDCLEWALKNDERYGVWGGTTPRERARLKGQGWNKKKAIAIPRKEV